MTSKILFIDDEKNMLSIFERKFRGHFDMHFASGGKEGLELLDSEGPFAVVVSDLRMPGLNGIQFLGEVKNRAPDTVPIMLTAYPGPNLATDAIDSEYIFRILTKPCRLEELFKSIEDGISEHKCRSARSSAQDLNSGPAA